MKLTPTEIDSALSGLSGWAYRAESLVKQFTLASFRDAIAFTTRLAFDAEAADHHPDLLINYKRVTVTWSTHDAGGVTQKDVDGAKATDSIAKMFTRVATA